MNMNPATSCRPGASIRAKMRRWGTLILSLVIFTALQLIGSQTGIAFLTKINRLKKWFVLALFVGGLLLVGLGVYALPRPFSEELMGLQILGIATIGSMIVVGYQADPAANSLRQARLLVLLGILRFSQFGLKTLEFLTNVANKKLVLKWLALTTIVCVGIWYRQPILEAAAPLQNQDAVVAYLNQFGPLAPVLLTVALVLQVFIAAIPGHVLILGGGYVYGFWAILAISLIATVGASQLAFLLAKSAGRPLVERLAPPQVLDKWNGAAEENGMVFFMFAFMLPIFPADVMNYVAGLSSLNGRRFFVANFFGRLPGLILLSVLGANGLTVTPLLMLTLTAVGLLMFVGWYYLFVHKKKLRPSLQKHNGH